MNLSSKAKNLIFLNKLNLRNSKIPKFLKYTVEELKKSKHKIIKDIKKKLEKKIIVRSSFYLEDNKNFSMAGEFEGSSNLNNDKKNIIDAINKILIQYKKKSKKKFHYLKSEIIFQNYMAQVFPISLKGIQPLYCPRTTDGPLYFKTFVAPISDLKYEVATDDFIFKYMFLISDSD